jgi:hypothetical protein
MPCLRRHRWATMPTGHLLPSQSRTKTRTRLYQVGIRNKVPAGTSTSTSTIRIDLRRTINNSRLRVVDTAIVIRAMVIMAPVAGEGTREPAITGRSIEWMQI